MPSEGSDQQSSSSGGAAQQPIFRDLNDARQFLRKTFKHRHQRTSSDERIYHGACMPDWYLSGRDPKATPPKISEKTVAPLPGCAFNGSWGTASQPVLRDGCESQFSAEIMASAGGATRDAASGGSRRVYTAGCCVASHDGRKRVDRGGSSEDAFTCITDLLGTDWSQPDPTDADADTVSDGDENNVGELASGPREESSPTTATAIADDSSHNAGASSPTTPGTGGQSQASVRFEPTPGRVFSLFGVFDGHRSTHAARFCAGALARFLARELRRPGVLHGVAVMLSQ